MEKIFEVFVKPNAKHVKIIEIGEKSLEIHLKSQPIKGAATMEIPRPIMNPMTDNTKASKMKVAIN